MTHEQIKQAAREYIWESGVTHPQSCFIAGAEFRQVEIDELVRWLDDIIYCIDTNQSIEYKRIKELLKKYEI